MPIQAIIASMHANPVVVLSPVWLFTLLRSQALLAALVAECATCPEQHRFCIAGFIV
jgi:hypothetical protein